MKKRYVILAFAFVLILMSARWLPAIFIPVRPFIQLPGEIYPQTISDGLFGGLTNTFMASLLAYAIVLFIAFRLRASTRTADEVPSGFYNFFEWILEGAYNFASNIAGEKKVKDFFPFFMTYLLFLGVANLLGLMPGFDSIGIWEYKPHFYELKEMKAIKGELQSLYENTDAEGLNAYVDSLEETYHLEGINLENGYELPKDAKEHIAHAIMQEYDDANIGDLRIGSFLVRKDVYGVSTEQGEEGSVPYELLHSEENHSTESSHDGEHHGGEHSDVPVGEKVGYNAEAGDWTIVPFLRPASTDLNLTLALAIVAMLAVQYFGVKHLGGLGYASKFLPFLSPTFGKDVAKNPIRAVDIFVGLLELIGEFSKVISFAFRLLGNLFAGMVLLFVMAFLLPAANIIFFGLEFFVGLIQALVFALLMLIFMVSATESHHEDEAH